MGLGKFPRKGEQRRVLFDSPILRRNSNRDKKKEKKKKKRRGEINEVGGEP